MKKTIGFAAALLSMGAVAACAHDPGRAAPAALSPQEIVAARQSAFGLSAGNMGLMKAVIDGRGDVRPAAFGARMMARWAETLPTMFPAGTEIPPTRARPEVWSDRAGFEARAAAYSEAAAELARLAAADDREGFARQWTTLRGTCQACHETYRIPND